MVTTTRRIVVVVQVVVFSISKGCSRQRQQVVVILVRRLVWQSHGVDSFRVVVVAAARLLVAVVPLFPTVLASFSLDLSRSLLFGLL